MSILLHIPRIDYTATTTIGLFAVDGSFWGYTLEDARRKEKIPAVTCIPPGRYKVIVSFSNRFQRYMPEVLAVPNYAGVRIHGGNDHTNTEGCPLIAANRVGRERVQGTLEGKLLEYLASKCTGKRPADIKKASPEAAEFWATLPPTSLLIQDGPGCPV